MKTKRFNQTLGVVLSCFAALAVCACDEGSGTSGGAGGSGGDGTSSGASTTGSGTGGSMLVTSLIDDMEDMEGSILASNGRQGAWYTFGDMTGTQMPPEGTPFTMAVLAVPRTGSNYAANTTGSGFTVWGAGMGFDLNNNGTVKSAYDASQYTGITFWAMAGPNGIKNIRMNIGDRNTAPQGGVCDPMTANSCDDHFGNEVVLTDTWQQFVFPFANMKQVGFSMANLPAIDKAALYAVQFQAGKNVTYDFWIDDIAFYQ